MVKVKYYSNNLGSNLAATVNADLGKNTTWKPISITSTYDNMKKMFVIYLLYDDGVAGTSEVTE